MIIIYVRNGNQLVEIFKSRLIFNQNYKMVTADIFLICNNARVLVIMDHIGLDAVNHLDVPAAFHNVGTGLSRLGEGMNHAVIGYGNGGMPKRISLFNKL